MGEFQPFIVFFFSLVFFLGQLLSLYAATAANGVLPDCSLVVVVFFLVVVVVKR